MLVIVISAGCKFGLSLAERLIEIRRHTGQFGRV